MFKALTKGACMAEETGKEIGGQAQELIAQGKEVAAEYYEEGRNQVGTLRETNTDEVGRPDMNRP